MSGFGMVLAMRLSDKCDSNNELLTLLAIGNYVDENGRGCYAAQQTLAEKVLVSVDTVKRCIPRLAAKGLIVPGDPSLVAHLRSDRRPRVWDILGAREPAGETGVQPAPSLSRHDAAKPLRGVHDAPSSDNPSSATVHDDPSFVPDEPTGVQTISPRGCTVHPNPPKEEPVKDPLPLPQQLLRKAGLGLTEDEETSFIAYANTLGTTGHKGPKWWRKVESEGDLPGLVAAWRATQATTANARDSPTPPPVDHCGQCSPDRLVEDEDGNRTPCQTCHPNRRTHP